MKSAIVDKDRVKLIRLCRQMTPEERLKAYVRHCQLMDQVYRAGQAYRSKLKTSRSTSKRMNT